MNFHQAACVAAIHTRSEYPLDDHPVVGTIITGHHALTVTMADVDDVLKVIDAVAPQVATAAITLVAEAFHADVTDPDDPPIPGTLEHRHQQGDPDVKAIIVVASVTVEGFRHTALAYRVDPDAHVLWDPPDEGTYSAGTVPDRMAQALDQAINNPDVVANPTTERLILNAIAHGLQQVGVPADVTTLPPPS